MNEKKRNSVGIDQKSKLMSDKWYLNFNCLDKLSDEIAQGIKQKQPRKERSSMGSTLGMQNEYTKLIKISLTLKLYVN